MARSLDVRKYTLSDQQRFAELAGDFNPLHVDPVRARRECLGQAVVHGVNALLGGLNAYAAGLRQSGLAGITLTRVAARFPGPIYLDQAVRSYVAEEADGRVKLQTRTSGQLLMEVEADWTPQPDTGPDALPEAPPDGEQRTPREVPTGELEGRHGRLPLYVARRAARAAFPGLSALVPLRTVAELLALTRLVGMECPGLYSILSALEVEFGAPATDAGWIEYEVAATDDRFGMVQLRVRGPAIVGTVDTFCRPPPQEQPPLDAAEQAVSPGEFAGQRALVIGGSRGLGEVTAKLVAAGGGHPAITYHRGKEDGERVAAAIQSAGRPCEAVQCDVSRAKPALVELARCGFAPTHLYYFASPRIFVKKGGPYSPRLFRHFARFYVDDFARTCRACRAVWTDPLVVFYPSTVAVHEKVRTLAEYAAAKAAGEALCSYLPTFDRGIETLVKRLPRIATDQTLTLLRTPAADALEVMLGVVREMHAQRPGRDE